MGWNVVTRWTRALRTQPDPAARAVIEQANRDAWDRAYAEAARNGGAPSGFYDHRAVPAALVEKYGSVLPREVRAAMTPMELRAFDRYVY